MSKSGSVEKVKNSLITPQNPKTPKPLTDQNKRESNSHNPQIRQSKIKMMTKIALRQVMKKRRKAPLWERGEGIAGL